MNNYSDLRRCPQMQSFCLSRHKCPMCFNERHRMHINLSVKNIDPMRHMGTKTGTRSRKPIILAKTIPRASTRFLIRCCFGFKNHQDSSGFFISLMPYLKI